ncbi:alpha,alpha-trehalose-phosphate synthase (UDP-forming) [Hoeflea ulvae]|uniref:Trehalose-6-phosphate synthase n=1 Tax=Hoeflea ulvae TaxID=2983764 RepID=A0ABT3YBS0_9HYPH|nr:trehalose-6-phosphate synthase [Hoeflea ulvae]MCY0093335.1 trehalose-6-phosphate synthase [Hoeflea ulvae]
MGRLVIISNRAPSVDGSGDSGGLVVALKDALAKDGGLWIGGAPKQTDAPSPSLIFHHRQDFDIGLFELEPKLYRDYYLGYSNSVLWPALHGRVDLIDVQPCYAAAYREVAGRLARLIAETVRDDDLIWVHDYQLIPLAHELKALGVKSRIGFFLHIPLPDLQTFKAIPDWRDLARWLADYDLIGFQTRRDLGHMINIFRHTLRGELRSNGNMGIAGREVALGCFPISINVDGFRRLAAEGAVNTPAPSLPRLIGVDRLDYSKGLPQRLVGYQKFLESHAAFHGKVSLLQIAPPTRDDVDAYKAIRTELEHLAGHINGRFGTVDWTPVQYIHRALPRDELAVLFRLSRVGLVTPLFDGMNLVAKEYVAAQDAADPGVLVLSQFAGAAEEMPEALIVNPHDPQDIAQAISTALEMPLGERIERHDALYSHLQDHDVDHWCAAFLKRLVSVERLDVDGVARFPGLEPWAQVG